MRINSVVLVLCSFLLFQSCKDCVETILEDPNGADCLELELNIGDPCNDEDETTYEDTVSEGCECVGTPYDCLNLLLNVGDPCDDGNMSTMNDFVTDTCTCVGQPTDFDCGDLQLNIGDECDDGDETTLNDVVNEECVCTGESIFDCPELQANIGDSCDDQNETTINDLVTADCECLGTPLDYDCPELNANIGDSCDDQDSTTMDDIVNENCECIGQSIYDCPELQANIGDSCDDGNPDTVNDTVNDACECIGEVPPCGDYYALTFGEDMPGGTLVEQAVSFSSPFTFPITSTVLENNSFIDIPVGDYSAFDHQNDRYAFAYTELTHGSNQLYSYDVSPFNSSLVNLDQLVAAPVYLGGVLYGINFESSGVEGSLDFTILTVDVNSGITSELLISDVSFDILLVENIANLAVSSATDGNSNLYFLVGSQLITFNVISFSSSVESLEDIIDPDQQSIYLGLEYDSVLNRLLAMKTLATGNGDLEIVGISTDNFELSGINPVSSEVNTNYQLDSFALYSSVFNPCQNQYEFSYGHETGFDWITVDLGTLSSSSISSSINVYLGIEYIE